VAILRSIAFKVVRLVVVVIIVTLFTFWLTKLAPGDPVSKIKPFAQPAERAQITKELGLNESFVSQYTTWLGNFVTGDFGKLYDSGLPVRQVVNDRLPVSLELMVYAQLLSLLIAIPLGVFTAYRAGSRFDGITNTTMFALLALPTFVLALLLQIYVGAKWDWLPTQSTTTGTFPLSPIDNWQLMLMPTIALAAGQIAVYMRLLRSDMISTLQEDFITTARAKGITSRRVLFRHALRPSSLTLLTVAGLNVGSLISGAIVIEAIFGLPGIGDALYRAILAQQFPAELSYVAIIAVFYVLFNFLVDFFYTVLDPRIRHARALA
jgi:peptide/nickel transport system permease protein